MSADEHWHGTANGYSNRRCRCPECREAWRVYYGERRRRRRGGELLRPKRDPICTVEGCDLEHHALGLCRAHWDRYKRAEVRGTEPDLTTVIGGRLTERTEAELAVLAEEVAEAAAPLTLYALMWLMANPESLELGL